MTLFRRSLALILSFLIAAVPAAAQPAAPALPWPERIEPAGHPGSLGVIRPIEAVRLESRFVSPFYRIDDHDRADIAALLGDSGTTPKFEGPGSFIYRVSIDGARTSRERRAEYFVYVSAGESGEDLLLQRTWFAYLPARGQPRGLALLMPGMFGTPEPILNLCADRLRLRGWSVLRMMSHPSRFTERIDFELDLHDLASAVQPVAREMTDRAAEAAFAAEAAVAHIARQHPHLAEVPRIAVGMSGGGIILPTVVAREPEQYAASVIIAGGSNFFATADESNYRQMIDAVGFRWKPAPPTPEQRALAYRLYLQHAPLDSANTAALLVGRPILMIHGAHDGAVPAHLGDQMWEQLGRPERWTEEAGHEEVFMHLPQRIEKIIDWLDAAVGAPPSDSPPAEPPGISRPRR
jgi:dienelactone hydrolase